MAARLSSFPLSATHDSLMAARLSAFPLSALSSTPPPWRSAGNPSVLSSLILFVPPRPTRTVNATPSGPHGDPTYDLVNVEDKQQ